MSSLAALLLPLGIFLAWGSCPAAIGQEPSDAERIGREALSRRSYPWYDAEKEEAEALRVGEKSTTNTDPKRGPGPSNTTSSAPIRVPAFSLFGAVVQVVGIVALISVLAGVAIFIAWAFLRIETNQSQGAHVVSASQEVDRTEQLPVTLKRTAGDFLAEARRLAEAGNYSEAIVYLYSHLLVQLDKHHVIRLAKGKTNRQYVRETRVRPVLAGILETTMVAFEDVFFGHHDLEQDRFEECLGQVSAFDADLGRMERAAA